MRSQPWPVLQNNNKLELDVYQASVYFNWKSCVDVVAVVTINHLGVFLSNYCDVNAPKNLISSGALLHLKKNKKQNKTFYKPVSEVTDGIGKTALIKRPRTKLCFPPIEHEHLHLHWTKERKLLLEMKTSYFVDWNCLLAIKYNAKWYKYATRRCWTTRRSIHEKLTCWRNNLSNTKSVYVYQLSLS